MENILVELDKSKSPYIKTLTDDNIINLTGESGSGKSYYAKEHFSDENYIVLDSDEFCGRGLKSKSKNKYNIEFYNYLKNKYDEIPSLIENFDLIYEEIINYFSNVKKTIVIDSAQFRNIKNINLLKGMIIIIRTSINKCYEQCLARYKTLKPEATDEEFENYKLKKKKMYDWYKSLNDFILKIDKI